MTSKFHAVCARMSISTSVTHLQRPCSIRHGVAVALVCAVLASSLHAENADRDQPLKVEADSGRYDDVKQVGVFAGNVVVTKGTMVLRATRVELQQSPEGYQIGVATGEPGQLVSYRQQREGDDEYIEGRAERIEYDGKADTIRLVNRAVIRRYRGGALADETAGSVITYDHAASMLTVVGGASGAASGALPGKPAGRVRATIATRRAASATETSPPAAANNPSKAVKATSPGDKP